VLSFEEQLVSGPFEARTEWPAGITHTCLPIRSRGAFLIAARASPCEYSKCGSDGDRAGRYWRSRLKVFV